MSLRLGERHIADFYGAYPYSATYPQTFNMRCQVLASAHFFSPVAMSEISLVIAPLGPLRQTQDVGQREDFQWQHHLQQLPDLQHR